MGLAQERSAAAARSALGAVGSALSRITLRGFSERVFDTSVHPAGIYMYTSPEGWLHLASVNPLALNLKDAGFESVPFSSVTGFSTLGINPVLIHETFKILADSKN